MDQLISAQCPGNGKWNVKSVGRKEQNMFILFMIDQAVSHKDHRGTIVGKTGVLYRPVCPHGTARNKSSACSGKMLSYGTGKKFVFGIQMAGADHSHRRLGQ